MKRHLAILLLLLSISGFVKSQSTAAYQKLIFIKDNDTLPYRLLLPENFSTSKKTPLILFLHGAGERGNDNESQLVHGADLFLRDSIREKYPAIVLFPQCPQNGFWSNVNIKAGPGGQRDFNFQTGGLPTLSMALLEQLLKQIIKKYQVTRKQIYVGGLSMGGMGTFEIVSRNPDLFAAAFPICGGADTASAIKLRNVNWWIFHGAKDDVVAPEFSKRIVTALQKLNVNVKFSLYPEANHNSWDNAFAEPQLMAWLFSNKK